MTVFSFEDSTFPRRADTSAEVPDDCLIAKIGYTMAKLEQFSKGSVKKSTGHRFRRRIFQRATQPTMTAVAKVVAEMQATVTRPLASLESAFARQQTVDVSIARYQNKRVSVNDNYCNTECVIALIIIYNS